MIVGQIKIKQALQTKRVSLHLFKQKRYIVIWFRV